jgi:hypothetical protein
MRPRELSSCAGEGLRIRPECSAFALGGVLRIRPGVLRNCAGVCSAFVRVCSGFARGEARDYTARVEWAKLNPEHSAGQS